MDRREELQDMVEHLADMENCKDNPFALVTVCRNCLVETLLSWLSEHYTPKEEK